LDEDSVSVDAIRSDGDGSDGCTGFMERVLLGGFIIDNTITSGGDSGDGCTGVDGEVLLGSLVVKFVSRGIDVGLGRPRARISQVRCE
jgi:hypothetical protein